MAEKNTAIVCISMAEIGCYVGTPTIPWYRFIDPLSYVCYEYYYSKLTDMLYHYIILYLCWNNIYIPNNVDT